MLVLAELEVSEALVRACRARPCLTSVVGVDDALAGSPLAPPVESSGCRCVLVDMMTVTPSASSRCVRSGLGRSCEWVLDDKKKGGCLQKYCTVGNTESEACLCEGGSAPILTWTLAKHLTSSTLWT